MASREGKQTAYQTRAPRRRQGHRRQIADLIRVDQQPRATPGFKMMTPSRLLKSCAIPPVSADCFQFLGLTKLRLDAPAFRNVLHRAGQINGSAILIVDELILPMHDRMVPSGRTI
jgi:hypothetical protein